MFKKAERKRVFLKIGMMGPSGSGKTYSALLLAKGLAQGGPIAGIDTENGSMSLYSTVANFDVVELEPPFHPKKCMDAIDEAVASGYKVLVIDSQTHFWKQILEDKERLDRAGGNSYTNWGKIKPQYEALKEKILHAPMHVICCLRAKDEYVIEKNERGKDAPRKVGMGAIAEPGAEFEYTTVFEIAMDHTAHASKDRTTLFDSEYERISEKTGIRLLQWLEGISASEPVAVDKAAVLKAHGLTPAQCEELKAKIPKNTFADLLMDAYNDGEIGFAALLRRAQPPAVEQSQEVA